MEIQTVTADTVTAIEVVEVPELGLSVTKTIEISRRPVGSWADFAASIHAGRGFASKADEQAMWDSYQLHNAILGMASDRGLI